MLKSEKYPHSFSQANAAQLNDVDEGGLNLGQVGGALRRRALLIVGVTGIVASAGVLKAKSDPPIYTGTFDILTNPVTGESKAIANIPQTINSQDAVAPPESPKQVLTTITVLQSPGVLDPVVKKLQAKYPDENLTYDSLTNNLTITSTQLGILEVQYTNANQKLVSDVLQLVSASYLNYSLAESQGDVDEAIKFVQERINKGGLRTRVQSWQEKLRTLRRTNNLVDPAQKAQEISSHIASLTQQRLDNRVQLEQMSAKYQNLQKEFAQQSGEKAANSVLSENPRYQKLLDQLQEVDLDIQKQSTLFTEEYTPLQRLREKRQNIASLLDQIRQQVNREFVSRIQELQARDLSLGEKIEGLNASLRTLASVSRDYDNIQQELKISSETLNQFLTKEQALQIEKAQKLQPWKLLDPKLTKVTKPQATSDSAKTNLALGGALGLLLGVGAALVVDKLSNVFYTSKELKDATRLPLLGVIPLNKELGALPSQDKVSAGGKKPRASFFEVFRSLYTNILLLGSDAPIRSLVISSAGQGDGKSTVAIQLAQAAAAMGQRVLLVDANLRSPCLHNRIGLMNIQGLTDVISQDLDWNNVIERSPIENNLFVMTAGPVPPDSVRLLASEKMQDLMSDLQNTFDLVIYDTPPLLGFADAYLLAANTNGMVLVAALGKLKRTVLQQAFEEIQVSGTPILGMVANKSKESLAISYTSYQQNYRENVSAELIDEDGESNVGNSDSRVSSGNRSHRP